MISCHVINSIKINNNINPIVWTVFSILLLIGFLLIFSIIIKKALPPSNAGSGKILINPTLILKKAIMYIKYDIPAARPVLTTWYTPTGPDKFLSDKLPVNKFLIVNHIVPIIDTNLVKAYLIADTNPLLRVCLITKPNT